MKADRNINAATPNATARRLMSGFTMVELLMTMAIMMIVMVSATRVMSTMVRQFKQQSKIAESSLEGSIGLEMLRRDLTHAGFGVGRAICDNLAVCSSYSKYDWSAFTTYKEFDSNVKPAQNYNDAPNAPRIVFAGSPQYTVPWSGPAITGPDYLVIRSLVATNNKAGGKFHLLYNRGEINSPWEYAGTDDPRYNIAPTDYALALALPQATGSQSKTKGLGLRQDAATPSLYAKEFKDVINTLTPTQDTIKRIPLIVYAILNSSDGPPRAPFNRTDYYMSFTNVPSRCAPQTGMLVKGIMKHKDGKFTTTTPMPIVDCVADFQVAFMVQSATDSSKIEVVQAGDPAMAALTAANLWDRLKEVNVYVLAHEGQRDPSFTLEADKRIFRSYAAGSLAYSANIITLPLNPDKTDTSRWLNYRWKLYTISVKPDVLRN